MLANFGIGTLAGGRFTLLAGLLDALEQLDGPRPHQPEQRRAGDESAEMGPVRNAIQPPITQ
jgi:hypothetical protein